MSYQIGISGHKEGLSKTAARAFEERIAEEARTFAAGLEGVTGVTFYGGSLKYRDLTPKPKTKKKETKP